MGQSQDLKNKTISGIFWQFLQRISGQLVSFTVSVVLARLLSPDDFGVVALAGMFTVLLGIFSSGGLGPALVKKKDADSLDFDTMFVTQLVFSSLMYIVIYFTAPIYADMYHNEQLTKIIRVSALLMPLGALGGVQFSVVSRRMQFQWLFYTSLVSLFASAAVGLYMAYSGYGPWALIAQNMTSTVVGTLVLFCLMDWHPRFRFSYQRFKLLFREGLKFMGTSLMGTFFGQLKGYALGLKYSTADLSYYNRGNGLPSLLCNNIDSTIQGVLFPALAQIQEDKEAVRRALSRAIRTSTFILMPLLFGLAAIADKVVVIIFSEKWAPSIPFMQILCFVLAISIMCNVNLQALKATGKIGTVFKLEFLKKPIMLLIILSTIHISPLAIAWGMLFFNIFVYFVNSYPNKKIINYSYKDQLIDVAPNILLSLFMAAIVYLIGYLNTNIYLCIIIQIVAGGSIYIGVSYLLRNDNLFYIINYIKERCKK